MVGFNWPADITQEELVGISFGSINTGLPKDIVKQIIDAEKIPITKMENNRSKVEDKKKLVGELTKLVEEIKVLVNSLVDERGLRELRVDTNEDIISVDLDKATAQPGDYQFEVVKMAQTSTALSSGFPDKDETSIGVGFIHYTLPSGEGFDLYVDKDNSTLEGIAKLINSNDTNGVKATIINDGSGSDEPWRLVLSLKNTGDDNYAEFPNFYFVDGDQDFYLEYEREAHDAVVKLDGFEIEVPENKIKDMIPGATINLKKARPGEEFSIKISEDTEAISEKINVLIEKINAVLVFINKQNALDEKSDTSRTLGGDITLQSLESRLRSIIFKDVNTSSGPKRLSDLGITFQRDGTIMLDKKKLASSISSDYKVSTQILTGWNNPETEVSEPGFIDNLYSFVQSVTRPPSGMLANRNKGLQSNIDQINKRIEDRQRMLEQKETTLKDKFARLESTISKIKNQGAGLAALSAQTAQMNPVTQLG